MTETLARHIQILPDHVANQIAAGEVVERPASVVKELVENALDAGAGRVHIELRNGGKTLIRVIDDGEGMARADALLALDRHATSKIRKAEDLVGVRSYGFRGEALPSIAAVSHLELETAPVSGGQGTRIRASGGRILSASEIARQPGTTVTVRSLFQNVPARAKFLRTAAAETRAASEAVVLLALGSPRTAFRLVSNGRELMDLAPADSLGERVAAMWGDEEAARLLEVDREAEGIRVAGLIQRPDAARPRGGRRYLFVNGRPFRDPSLVRAVDEAYRTTVTEKVRPTVLLFLGLEPGAVDVNVHPAKAEVRFREPDAVRSVVEEAVRERLGGVSSAPGIGPGVVPRGGGGPQAPGGSPPGAESGPGQLALFVSRRATASDAGETAAGPETFGSLPPGVGPAVGAASRASLEAEALPDVGDRLRPWQLHDTYILVSTRDGLLIIDQHSAHERVLFEEFMRGFAEGGAASQHLLFPLTLRLSPAECAAVEELRGLLLRAGYDVESFGDRTVIIRAAPHPHPYFDADACFREMIHELAHGSALVDSARNQHERIAKSLACKAAVKAGHPLSVQEMEELVDRLFATELPGHDVHGRPTILRLSMDELARRFGRS